MTRIAPYGAWESPVDARTAASQDGRPDFPGRPATRSGGPSRARRADTMIACPETELPLYGQDFGFHPTDVPRLELRT